MGLQFNNSLYIPFFMLLFFSGITACDAPSHDQNNKENGVIKTDDIAPSKDISELELEAYLNPLKLQIEQLESDLKESQNAALLAFEKNDNEQWNISKLQERVVALEEDKQDLTHQLETKTSELTELQKALDQDR